MNKLLPLAMAFAAACQLAVAQVSRSTPPSGNKESSPVTSPKGDGFKAEYFNGSDFERKVLTRVDRQIDFFLIDRSPAPGVDAGYFSVRWTGQFYAPKTGRYRFTFVADDGVRLWVGGKLIIDQWHLNRPTPFSGEVSLKAQGLYSLRIEYSQMKPRAAVARATWSFEEEPAGLLTDNNVFSKHPAPLPTAVVAKKEPVKSALSKALVAKKASPARVQQPVAHGSTLPLSGNKAEPTEVIDPAIALEAVRSVSPKFIFFDQGRSDLQPETFVELDKLAAMLLKYPDVRVFLTGHTDNAGDFMLNVALSNERARTVAGYLSARGVVPERITWKGLGGVYPVSPNTTEQNRQKNRRVEFIWQ